MRSCVRVATCQRGSDDVVFRNLFDGAVGSILFSFYHHGDCSMSSFQRNVNGISYSEDINSWVSDYGDRVFGLLIKQSLGKGNPSPLMRSKKYLECACS